MSLQSILGAWRATPRLQFNLRRGNETIQAGCRAYRTMGRTSYRSPSTTARGTRLNAAKSELGKAIPGRQATSFTRSFGSSSKQFALPNGQLGPIPKSSNSSTLLRKAFDILRFRQKRNISTRTRPTASRKQHPFRQRFSTSRSNRRPEGDAKAKAESNDHSLGARMKRLSREYGWSALGVYLLLSALDFPFCYLLVRYLGTDLIGEWEEYIVGNIKAAIPASVKETWHNWRTSMKKAEQDITGRDDMNHAAEMAGWGVEEAQEQHKKDASLATQLALAYAIHKSFIFIRVPLTAAVTPRVVKILRGWGWDIGKKTSKAEKAIKRREVAELRKKRADMRKGKKDD